MPVATINGIELCYETFGSPDHPALVLINGLGSQMIRWPQGFKDLITGAGFYLIVFAVAAAAVAALSAFGDFARGETTLSALALLFVLLAAAARGQTPETVPPVSTTATVAALLLLGLAALLRTGAPRLRRAQAR